MSLKTTIDSANLNAQRRKPGQRWTVCVTCANVKGKTRSKLKCDLHDCFIKEKLGATSMPSRYEPRFK